MRLSPFKGLGHPGWFWLFRDVGGAHFSDSGKPCVGITYGYGPINENGVLADMPDTFRSHYNYNGYMVLFQASPDCLGLFVKFECGDSYSPVSLENALVWDPSFQ